MPIFIPERENPLSRKARLEARKPTYQLAYVFPMVHEALNFRGYDPEQQGQLLNVKLASSRGAGKVPDRNQRPWSPAPADISQFLDQAHSFKLTDQPTAVHQQSLPTRRCGKEVVSCPWRHFAVDLAARQESEECPAR